MYSYPDYKKAFIEARRVFVGVFLGELSIIMFSDQVRNTLQADFINMWGCLIPLDKGCIYNTEILSHSLSLILLPSIGAAYKGVIKYAQEKWGKGDYSKFIYKL